MNLSIVSILPCSPADLAEFCRRASAAAQRHSGDDYEIILVNDGSSEYRLSDMVASCPQDRHVVVIDLSRNFGFDKAIMTGLAHSRGEHVFLIDSNLMEDPAWLEPFAALMSRKKADAVYGVHKICRKGLFERLADVLFYRLFRTVTGVA
ncbi:MAG: glycosyltransferase, partial [Burkholderiales bacterium]